MKKSNLCLLSIFAVLILSLFASCQNFCNGSQIKNELEQAIAYSKYREVTVRLSSTDNIADFISGSGDVVLKPTDKRTVEFEIDTEKYFFDDWTVLDKKDGKTDLSSNVSIKTTQKEKVFSAEFSVIPDTPDLLLIANISYLPAVTSFEPANTVSGVTCYKAIRIKFATPMNAEDLESFDNITISDNSGISINNYFETPKLSDDGKTLTINPSHDKIPEIFKTSQTVTITVKLLDSIREKEERSEKFKGYDFSYKVNNIKDNVPPEVSEFKLYRKIVNLDETKDIEELEAKPDEMNNTPFDAWDENETNEDKNEFYTHANNGKVYVSFVAKDTGSGIAGVKVTEERIKDSNGNNVSEYPVSGYIDYGISETEDSVYTAEYAEYEIKSYNGVIKLTFSVEDSSNNSSTERTYYVIKYHKDSGIFSLNTNSERELPFYNKLWYATDYPRHPVNNLEEVQVNLQLNYYDRYFYKINNEKELKTTVLISVGYQNEEANSGTLVTKLLGKDKKGFTDDEKNRTIERDPYKNTDIMLKTIDFLGDLCTKNYNIPPVPQKTDVNIIVTETPKRIVFTKTDSQDNKDYYFSFEEQESKKSTYVFGNGNEDSYVASFRPSENELISLYGAFPYKYSEDLLGKTYKVYLYCQDDKSLKSSASIELMGFTIQKDSAGKYYFDFGEGNSEIAYPTVNTIEVTPGPGYSGYYNVNVTLENQDNSDYTWEYFRTKVYKSGVSYKEYTTSSYRVSLDSLDFTVPSDGYYCLGVYAVNSLGIRVGEKLFAEAAQIIDASVNIGSPNSKQNVGYYAPNMITVAVNEDNKNLFNGDKASVEYWVIPGATISNANYSYSDYYSPEFIEVLEANYTEKGTYTFTSDDEYTDEDKSKYYLKSFPINSSEEQFFYFVYRIHNNTKNYTSELYFSLEKCVVEDFVKFNEISINSDDASIYDLKFTKNSQDSVEYTAFSVQAEKWEILNNLAFADSSIGDIYPDSYTSIQLKSEKAKKGFIKVVPNSVPIYYRDIFSQALYICPEYLLAGKTLTRAAVLENTSSCQVFTDSDAPFIVERLYHCTNLETAEMWGSRGVCAYAETFAGGDTLCQYKGEIPSGNWYVTLIHYADGTSWMGTPKYKK